MKKTQKPETMGAHWKETGYSPLYQLYGRVETVAAELEHRRQRGWVPSKKHIAELYGISIELKIIDSRSNRTRVKGSGSQT